MLRTNLLEFKWKFMGTFYDDSNIAQIWVSKISRGFQVCQTFDSRLVSAYRKSCLIVDLSGASYDMTLQINRRYDSYLWLNGQSNCGILELSRQFGTVIGHWLKVMTLEINRRLGRISDIRYKYTLYGITGQNSFLYDWCILNFFDKF